MQQTHTRWTRVAFLAAIIGLSLSDCAQVEQVSDEYIAANRHNNPAEDASVGDDASSQGGGGSDTAGNQGSGGDPGGAGGSNTGGKEGTAGAGGKGGTGGSTVKPDAGGTGGVAKPDGGSGGTGTGGVAAGGGGNGTGGVGTGGIASDGSISGGTCTPSKTYDLSKGTVNAQDLGTAETCFSVTGKKPAGMNCSNMEDRTLTVNGTKVTCTGSSASALPAAIDGAYYFLVSAGSKAYAGMSIW